MNISETELWGVISEGKHASLPQLLLSPPTSKPDSQSDLGSTHAANRIFGERGKGLWGRDCRTAGPTEIRYALLPHPGRWDRGRVPAATWQQPVTGAMSRGAAMPGYSLVNPGDSGWEVPAMFVRDGQLIVRLFNASGDDQPQKLKIGFDAGKVELLELDGRVIEKLIPQILDGGTKAITLQIPRLGIRTLRFSEVSNR
ncbi:MAG: hypothetical protein IT422_04100 [Pirellulaceae bacterium]|nr:hypothetical protein [Pirellulaceae bacterium]